eukprot:CAMPEP_0180425898 /NCGR_PEP_ID=MMETSP1036_2-20121128/5509_1 /TAXON_ID=632150 /ORGANISM="Azadinium spinosum, Strain 3D9" /LENGTH=291 /DNA_ID=CAMNT_0022431419 /DNA_START=75 /DNA_END=950 /DNA_ORIENTATION=+
MATDVKQIIQEDPRKNFTSEDCLIHSCTTRSSSLESSHLTPRSQSKQKLLELQSRAGMWAIPRKDIQIGKELSHTLKSQVYYATWNRTKVVAKCLLMVEASSPNDAEERTDELLHEIEILASLRHPDLVMFLGADLSPEMPVMVISEFMAGGDLERYYMKQRQAMGRVYRPGKAQLMCWASAIARALAFLHGRTAPIIHRDLKPMNLLLTAPPRLDLKISDFGISKMVVGGSTAIRDGYVMTGGVGSWLYMAPEVVRYQQYCEKVDIYSFGLILFFMSSGKDPFHELGNEL